MLGGGGRLRGDLAYPKLHIGCPLGWGAGSFWGWRGVWRGGLARPEGAVFWGEVARVVGEEGGARGEAAGLEAAVTLADGAAQPRVGRGAGLWGGGREQRGAEGD